MFPRIHIHPLTLASLGYTAAKELTSVGRLGSAMSSYGWNATYDAKSRLDTWTVGNPPVGTPTEDYSLDAAGNWNSVTKSGSTISRAPHNAKNQMTTLGANAVTYDSRGNMTNYSQNGKNYWLDYDPYNQLNAHWMDDGVSYIESAYVYDALGRRVSSYDMDYNSSALFDINIFVYGPDFKLLQTVKATYDWSELTLTPNSTVNYVWGRSFNELVWTSAAANGATNTGGSYAHGDQIGSIIGYTSSTGTIQQLNTYTPYGERSSWTLPGGVLTSATASVHLPFGYSGEYEDPTGLNYYGYRYYAPKLGRWINRDPIGELGGANLYEMVGGGALNTFDQYGLTPALLVLKCLGSTGLNSTLMKLGDLANKTASARDLLVDASLDASTNGRDICRSQYRKELGFDEEGKSMADQSFKNDFAICLMGGAIAGGAAKKFDLNDVLKKQADNFAKNAMTAFRDKYKDDIFNAKYTLKRARFYSGIKCVSKHEVEIEAIVKLEFVFDKDKTAEIEISIEKYKTEGGMYSSLVHEKCCKCPKFN